ncbi:hypothetical protein [Microbacterium sp.]|uniref:hypothetical protein n=1 Tax=Microbacterium sp. TaxID=51671 RepID=UPI001ACD81E0|nr:hypothetical protein [Microbacterium sp.]MBN9155815.1 hypothetical protein [Microbacterium sp.]
MIDWSKIIVGTALVAAAIWLFVDIRDQGAESVRTSIERQNNEAGNTADGARSAYDRCLDGGGLWNFGAGRCDGPAPRGGD